MSYAIYVLKATNPAALGLDSFVSGMSPKDMSPVFDTRFMSFGKTQLEVQVDVFKFIAEQHQALQDRRVPDDLELMYNHEVKTIDGIAPDVTHSMALTEIELTMRHDWLANAYSSVKVEVKGMVEQATCDLLDEAREIVRDRDVTIMLARVSNPMGRIMELTSAMTEVDRTSRERLKLPAVNEPEHFTAELQKAVDKYLEIYQGLRIVKMGQPGEI